MADIPGLIGGASEGAGLGIQFLRHLRRTRLLLHLVDIQPMDESQDPVENVRVLERELEQFDETLAQKPRWLVLNKTDLLLEEELDLVCDDIVKRLEWTRAVYRVSAVTGAGTDVLMANVMTYIEELNEQLS